MMGWSQGHLNAATTALRQAAVAGEFVTGNWIDSIQKNDDGGYSVYGCAWGQIGWAIAVFELGAGLAQEMLSVESGQSDVNWVLKGVGVTRAELKSLDPYETWVIFDSELDPLYENRYAEPEAFIEKSCEMAEYFIKILQHIPIAEPAKKPTVSVGVMKTYLSALFGRFKAEVPVLLAA